MMRKKKMMMMMMRKKKKERQLRNAKRSYTCAKHVMPSEAELEEEIKIDVREKMRHVCTCAYVRILTGTIPPIPLCPAHGFSVFCAVL